MHDPNRPDDPPVRDPRPLDAGVELDLDGDHAVLRLCGEIDAVNSGRVSELGSHALAEPGVADLVVDLSAVTFLNSSGLGALVQLRNRSIAADKRLALRGVPRVVSTLFTLTNLDVVFGLGGDDTGRC